MKKTFTLLLVLLITILDLTAQTRGIRPFVANRIDAKDHIALIIGNSNYPDMPLANPNNDATAVAESFEQMGFITEKVLDADKETMGEAIKRFTEKLYTAKAAVFYYAGHGMQVDGENYLIPIGINELSQISTEDQVAYRAINAGEILSAMEREKVKFSLIVLDACRNNPIKSNGRGKIKGLASINAPLGSLVMYATKAGDVASDGVGKNSPFTTAFLQHIKTPGLDVNLLPSRVTKTVNELTNGNQTPGSYVQLTQSFTFVPKMTASELEELKKQQEGKLSELQQKEIADRIAQEEEEALMQEKELEILALEKKIAEIKRQTIDGGGDLDEMLKIVEERKLQNEKLKVIQDKIDRERKEREDAIAKLKEDKYNETIDKYNKIANSEFGQDMKEAAWTSVLKNLGVENKIEIGNIEVLKSIFFDIPIDFTDIRDGKKYKIAYIGDQVWMAENLAFKSSTGKYWAYEEEEKNVEDYGYLYNFETAKQVCPAGWHLPSDQEFDILLEQFDNVRILAFRELIPSGNSGFNAQFGGYRSNLENFYEIGTQAAYWSSSCDINGDPWILDLRNSDKLVYKYSYKKIFGLSVRCIQNKE